MSNALALGDILGVSSSPREVPPVTPNPSANSETAIFGFAGSGAAVFASAFLLFLLEPLIAREILPTFGGSAAVWTTCLVFFQSALLGGYFYAHLSISYLRSRAQALLHLLLLALAVLGLRASVSLSMHAVVWHPIPSILWLLTARIGLPFFVLASTTPLLQAWHARLNPEETSGRRWRLFALSNTGSLLGLVAYPTVVETYLDLHTQSLLWSAGFCLFALLCGALAVRGGRVIESPLLFEKQAAIQAREQKPDFRRRHVLWILLPACGSMLLCAVTNHLSQNIAAIPLLWILPLAAYLLSFIVAFASPRSYPLFVARRMLALTLATFAYLLYTSRTTLPLQVSIPVYIAALFFACLFCHGELYRLRPAEGSSQQTHFYLLLSFGSLLGAIFVGVFAPGYFHANYDLLYAVIFLAALAVAVTLQEGWVVRLVWTVATAGAIYVGVVYTRSLSQDALVQLRSFYGSLRVTETHFPPDADTTRTLYHGTIQHGSQLFGNGFRTVPTTYFAYDSGVGLTLDLCCEGRSKNVGIVGLGAGTLAAYGRAGDRFTFYEINPQVDRLARLLFTYMRDSPATIRVVIGDARLSLASEKSAQPYDVLVLDAFSGDAIPVHLLTAQAIALYRQRLHPDGILALHVSSQYLDLAPELALQAQHAGIRAVLVHSGANEARGEFSADWVLMSADPAFFVNPEIANASAPLPMQPGLRLWTDDYSSILPLLKWHSTASEPAPQPPIPPDR